MRRTTAVCVMVATTALWHTAAHGVPGDTLLIAYWLGAAEEAQFSRSDGRLSPFWGQWTGRDSMLLEPATDGYPGRDHWDGPDDARVVVKAAGGGHGLYLAFMVEDDVWIAYDEAGWFAEELRFYVDSMSSEGIAQCCRTYCDACMGTLGGGELTTTSCRLSIWLNGQTRLPDTVDVRGYESEDYCGINCGYMTSLTTAREWFCIDVEAVRIAPRVKALEFRFGWDLFAEQGPFCPKGPAMGFVPAAGTRQAFCVTYSDMDSAAQHDTCRLTSTGKDPWYDTASWGDIEFGPGFPPVPTPVESLLTAVGWYPESGRARSATHAVQGARFYTLTGRRVAGEAAWARPAQGVVVRESKSGRRVVVARR